jgi:hypothetical protein
MTTRRDAVTDVAFRHDRLIRWLRPTARRRPSFGTTAGHPTARRETWQASVPGWNAGRQPERPEVVVFEEMSLGSTPARGCKRRGFAPEVREPKFLTPGASDPRVLGPGVPGPGFVILNWMTDGHRETLIVSEQRSGFWRRWRSVCGGVVSRKNKHDGRGCGTDSSRSKPTTRRNEAGSSSGQENWGRKMSKPCRSKFGRPGPSSCR